MRGVRHNNDRYPRGNPGQARTHQTLLHAKPDRLEQVASNRGLVQAVGSLIDQ